MWSWLKRKVTNISWRHFIADTIARVTFSVATGMVIELSAGMTVTESLVSRAVAQPTTAITARPYGWLRDKALGYCGITKKQWFWWGVINIITYACFYCPQYAAIRYFIIGVGARETWIATGILAASSLLLGILFGLWLDLVRKIFGIKKPDPKNESTKENPQET